MYPALAVAAALSDGKLPVADSGSTGEQVRYPRVIYIGSVGGMEQRIVAGESTLPYRAVPTSALRGRGPLALVRGMVTMVSGIIAARALLHELRPAALLGTGGYVCVPVFLAARLARIPTMIYLPDVVPGLAVRLLARVATRVACSVEDSWRYLPVPRDALLVTGYPVRAALFTQDKAECRAAFGLSDALPVLLVYGGSRGARSINRAVAALLPDLLEFAQIIHVCGREGDAAWLRAAAARLEPRLQARYRLFPYLESAEPAAQRPDPAAPPPTMTMVRAFGAADLALCRSGASTLAELPAAGLPAILVPYPYVHQDENADYLVRHGAAVKVPDHAMLGDGDPRDGLLYRELRRLLGEETERRKHMAERSQALARPDAAHRLAHALLNLATRSGS